jgi:hypothetical protein
MVIQRGSEVVLSFDALVKKQNFLLTLNVFVDKNRICTILKTRAFVNR